MSDNVPPANNGTSTHHHRGLKSISPGTEAMLRDARTRHPGASVYDAAIFTILEHLGVPSTIDTIIAQAIQDGGYDKRWNNRHNIRIRLNRMRDKGELASVRIGRLTYWQLPDNGPLNEYLARIKEIDDGEDGS